MAEIDLIPREYRTWLEQQRMLRNALIAIALVNLAVIAAGALLSHSVRQANALATRLQADNAITQQQQLRLQQLKDQQAIYEQQWSLLRGLRAGAAVEDIFSLIDRSLVGDRLWFLDWNFRRAGIVIDGQTRGTETGYFIIVSETADPTETAELEVETRMSIHGQASDHEALSSFVRGLFGQPDIKDVNVRRTMTTNYANSRVVEFDITVILQSEYKGTG
ncbi:MAG: hypothetical protein R3288_07850 [Woeseiaceae bacterium]|nr:hypothetical protein [Woeseiaceae bacterium]